MKTHFIYFALVVAIVTSCTTPEVKTEATKVETPQKAVTQDTNTVEGDFTTSNTYDAKTMEDGKFETFYSDKTLKAEGMVTNGKREGVWTSYHPNGNKQSENEYVNGVLHGKTFTTFPNGQIMYIGYYHDGKYDGQWIYYKKDGELSKEIFYSKGEVIKLTEGKDYNK